MDLQQNSRRELKKELDALYLEIKKLALVRDMIKKQIKKLQFELNDIRQMGLGDPIPADDTYYIVDEG